MLPFKFILTVSDLKRTEVNAVVYYAIFVNSFGLN